MGRLRRAGALLGAAERDRGQILEPRFASSLATPAAQGSISPPRIRGPGDLARRPRSARRAVLTRRSAP
jgi:hypothetical protein